MNFPQDPVPQQQPPSPPQPPSLMQQTSAQTAYPGVEEAGYAYAFGDSQDLQTPSDPRFSHNLARYLNERTLSMMGYELVEMIGDDDAARDPWRRIIMEGLDYLGIGKEKPGMSRNMPKETNFYAPTLRKNALMMTSKLHQVLFPPNNFVNTVINGSSTDEAEKRSERIEAYFNYYLRDVAKEYIGDKKEALYWCVLMGSVFSKAYIDPLKRRPVAPYINAEDIILSQGATSIDDAERVTHQFTLPERVLRTRERSGQYISTRLMEAEDYSDTGIVIKASSKMGFDPVISDSKNKFYSFYECMTYRDIAGFEHLDARGNPSGRLLPYVITIERNSKKVIAIYRNWEENDPSFTPKNWITQYKLFSGFGAYGMGLFHLLLDLAKAETKTLSELLRAAELSNQPSFLQVAGSLKQESTQLNFTPGSVNRVNVGGDSNINNAMQPLPTKEPSATLLTLNGQISQAMNDLSTAREISPENIPTNTTATTMMGILSTMHILEDSVVNGFYASFKNELSLFYDLFGKWLPETPYPFSIPGFQYAILKADFRPDIIIQPVVDPNASSHMLQLITSEALNALAQQNPTLYDMKEINRRTLKAMRVSDIDKLFVQPPEPTPPPPQLDPVSENQRVMGTQPIQVYKGQDHDAHNTVHNGLLAQLTAQTSAPQDQNPPDHSAMIAALQAHIQSHETFKYMATMEANMGFALPDDPSQIPPDYQNQIAMRAAQVQQQKQQQDQAANPPPMDPQQVLMEDIKIKAQQNEMRHQIDQQKLAMEQAKIEQEAHLNQEKALLEEQKLQIERERIQVEAQRDHYKEQLDYAKLEIEKANNDLTAQTKAFGDTLRFEKDNHREPLEDGTPPKKED